MIVMKFGGSSLASGERIGEAAALVLRYRDRSPAVIVSAMGGVTDSLIGVARLAVQGRKVLPSVEEHLAALEQRHLEAARLVGLPEEQRRLREEIGAAFLELREICTGIALLGELSARSVDAVSAYGEKLAAPLLAAAFRARGQDAEAISAEEMLLTDAAHGRARPLITPSRVRARDRVLPLIDAGMLPVITGFIGATEDGVTTT
ncbi:MAG: hypothetical protein ACRDG4_17705, partial [Chloroflexota bacterium]